MSSLTKYPGDAMLARVLAMALCLSVCARLAVCHKSKFCRFETAARIRLAFGMRASFGLSYTVSLGNSGRPYTSKNKGTSVWNVDPKTLDLDNFATISRSSKMCCRRLSSTKVGAQSVINWTVVGWQYLRFRRSTASVPQWGADAQQQMRVVVSCWQLRD